MQILYRRYVEVFCHVWKRRKEFDPPPLKSMEAEFLPAALALRDAPAPAAPRILMWLLAIFAISAILWASFGQIDIVVTSSGKIIPNGYTKIVQPLEAGVVKTIYVKEGQAVHAGDPLIDLDTTISNADVEKNREDIYAAKLQAARAQSLWKSVTSNVPPSSLIVPSNIPVQMVKDEDTLLIGQYQEYRSKLSSIDAEIAHHRAELQTTEETIRKFEQTLPLAEERAEDYRNLDADQSVSHHAYLEKEQDSIEQRQDLATQRAHLQETEAAIVESQRHRDALLTETARTALDARQEAEQKMSELSQEFVKSEEKNHLTHLVAPIDGVIQQLVVHTIGGVVTPAQELLSVVPQNQPPEIEAWIENKDIGFVNEGDAAEVKIDTFQYTKYGTIHAVIKHLSRDAVQDKKNGLRFMTQVQLSQSTINIDGKQVKLSPGMSVSVEIKTGKRRVIEYFLSPLLQYKHESLRER